MNIFCVILILALLLFLFTKKTNAIITQSSSKCFSCVSPKTVTITDSFDMSVNHVPYDFLIDVRSDEEWLEKHVPHSIHIPIDTLVTELPKRVPNKESRILFCCKRGYRASGAETIAKEMGYTNVTHLDGKCTDLL